MVNSHEEELMAFNAMWNKQIEDISSEGDKHEKELADKHNN